METKQIIEKTEALIDALRATCMVNGAFNLKRLFIISLVSISFSIDCFPQNAATDSLILRAVRGDAGAQFNLGCYYHHGKNGIPKDLSQAVYWYRKAAEQGKMHAQFNLGSCYKNGDGVTQDYSQAVYWYRKAAEQGSKEAKNKLGFFFFEGKGVAKDYSQAIYWFHEVAEQGCDNAQYNLALCYEKGYGVSKDLEKAVYWYRKAAAQGLKDAQEKIDKIESSVSKDIKQKLDKRLRKFIESESDRREISLLYDDIFEKNGLYLGSVLVQHEIDTRIFNAFILKKLDLLIDNNIAPIYGKIIKNLGPNFYKTLNKELVKEIIMLLLMYEREIATTFFLKDVADNKKTVELIIDYMESSKLFPISACNDILDEHDRILKKEGMEGQAKTEQDSAYMLALLMYVIDKHFFEQVLQIKGVFSEEQFTDGSKTMKEYFESLMEEINPFK